MKLRKAFQTYGVIRIEDLSKVDFSQVGEDSSDTIRKNVLDPPTQFVLKWDSEPDFITDGTVIPDGLYTHEECVELMVTEVWSIPEPEVE
jgi:hypothetical protein